MMQEKFNFAISYINNNQIISNNIGTLSEKTLHKVVKKYLEEDEQFHEIKIGQYYADIVKDNQVIEIQTKQFNKMRDKLNFLLKDYQVTIVFPTFFSKWLNWIDPINKEVISRRLSPKKGSIYQIFPELYRIKNFLKNDNLHFIILLVDLNEYRLLNGWSKDRKKGSVCYERIPEKLIEEVMIKKPEDYRIFLKCDLPLEFTSKDYAIATKISIKNSQIALNVLSYMDVIERFGKKGKQYLYKIKE